MGGFQERYEIQESSDFNFNESYEQKSLKDLAVASKIYGKTTNRRYNSHLIINDEGQIVSKYRKMHLFDVDLTSKGGL